MERVLENIRVIDLTQALAGPYCTMMLGDLGADVIKIEPLGKGDQSRGWGPPFVNGESTYFLSINRNKRSMTLDIKSEQGRKVLHQLVESADVFICNIPKAASRERAGVDFETLQALNPALVYCLISGYGSDGPYAEMPGYDLIAQGASGLMSVTGEPDGEPMRYPIPISDITTGMYATIGILSALMTRKERGKGQFLDMTLFESQSAWLTILASGLMNGGKTPERLGNVHPSITPYQLYTAKDKHMVIAVGTEKLWGLFCEALDLQHLQNDERFATNAQRNENRAALNEILNALFVTEPADHWLEKLRSTGIPAGPINSIAETVSHPQHVARNFIPSFDHPAAGDISVTGNPIRLSDTPVDYRLTPPMLGEHNESILSALGYSPAEIVELREQGVI